MTWYALCTEQEIPKDKPLCKNVGNRDLCVTRTDDGEVFVFENLCTHRDRPLADGPWDPVEGKLTCPFHKAIFNLREQGKVEFGPTVIPLELYGTKKEESVIWVEL